MSGDISGIHNWIGGGYWSLVSGGQGCCEASYSTQDIPTTNNDQAQNIKSAKAKKVYHRVIMRIQYNTSGSSA